MPSAETNIDLFNYVLRLADDRLVLGHRTSEWCGHAPILEEDIALANIALDLVGQAQSFYQYAAEIEGRGRNEDQLAYFRNEREFCNLKLCELPRGDFAFTIGRHLFFHQHSCLLLEQLSSSKMEKLAALAAKCLKEAQYHLRHSAQWLLRLGDGTAESKARMQAALDQLWSYSAELFESNALDARLLKQGEIPDISALPTAWVECITKLIKEATLSVPSSECYMHCGARNGIHTEHLGHMLAEMQILPRSYPNARW